MLVLADSAPPAQVHAGAPLAGAGAAPLDAVATGAAPLTTQATVTAPQAGGDGAAEVPAPAADTAPAPATPVTPTAAAPDLGPVDQGTGASRQGRDAYFADWADTPTVRGPALSVSRESDTIPYASLTPTGFAGLLGALAWSAQLTNADEQKQRLATWPR